MIDTHFEEKLTAQFEAAFAVRATPLRTMPKTFKPQTPKTPWYLDPQGELPLEFCSFAESLSRLMTCNLQLACVNGKGRVERGF